MRKLNDEAAYEFFTWESWMIRQHMSYFFPLWHEKVKWSGSMWVCHMRMQYDQAAYKFVVVSLTWGCRITKQCLEFGFSSHENAEWSGSIWVCLMRKWCYQAAYEFVSWESGVIRQHMSVSWESGIIRQHLSLSHGKVVLSGSIWVCLMGKWYYQAAYEFVSWESGIIRQHLSFSHEEVVLSGSIRVCFCLTHMRMLTD